MITIANPTDLVPPSLESTYQKEDPFMHERRFSSLPCRQAGSGPQAEHFLAVSIPRVFRKGSPIPFILFYGYVIKNYVFVANIATDRFLLG
ncbi:MAG: hypothetical protein KDC19_04915 [Saprospiraceae bacterium]|nr:hypothetical protein [Saprospiraceae bacterium]